MTTITPEVEAEYHGPTPIFYSLMKEQGPDSYVRRLLGNGNELDQAGPRAPLAIEAGIVLVTPAEQVAAHRGRWPVLADPVTATGTIRLGGRGLPAAPRGRRVRPGQS